MVSICRTTHPRCTSRKPVDAGTLHLVSIPILTNQLRKLTPGSPDGSDDPEPPNQATTVARSRPFATVMSHSKQLSGWIPTPPRVLVMLLVLVGGLLGLPQQASASVLPVLPADQHQLVPAYFYPAGGNQPTNPWHVMCGRMKASTAIMNPHSGPGVVKIQDYTEALAFCHQKGQRVIGYVSTSYGARTLATVNADIDTYYRLYPGIGGIFVDEMPNCEACILPAGVSVRSYYSRIYGHVKQKSVNRGTVVGNPGAAASSAWQLNTPVADVIVVFEGSQRSYASWNAPDWVKGRAPARFSHLVYASASGSRHAACAWARSNNAGWIYVTDDVLPNPWDRLPTYWPSVAPLCQ